MCAFQASAAACVASIRVSSRARSKIKHVLQAEERTRSIELGRRLFEKEARRFDLNPKTLLESDELARFAADFRNGTFSIYHGDETEGSVRRISNSPG